MCEKDEKILTIRQAIAKQISKMEPGGLCAGICITIILITLMMCVTAGAIIDMVYKVV